MCFAQTCVRGMFEIKDGSAFKQHLRDFLVQTKAFAAQDNAGLFVDEQAQLKEVCLWPAWETDLSSSSLSDWLSGHTATARLPRLAG